MTQTLVSHLPLGRMGGGRYEIIHETSDIDRAGTDRRLLASGCQFSYQFRFQQ